ncbi:hypothetical protein HBI25_152000 [Parastagonospora nodorum]|nr:hypothetical protein HBH50_010860 [Parastagonospora nodorum]KAH4095706.1 hypothetical protein HBH48_046940 [Parastagonospora nodorum]KAH4118654.1 hypothetical protein HBH47_137260 [Parastagonospora nodorum]KAH4200883.1 hypothetical protein HBI95_168610 [Parastagonospora nodorum]KAH4259542.1 hypothetical protein HBI03_135650 [Parastagonospora nodorum]
MMRANFLAVVLSLASLSLAADCSLSQPRKEGDPSGQQIAKAIGTQTELDRICSGQWRTGDEKRLENSFNHWGVVYKVSRTDSKNDLKYCKKAFRNIIEQCVSSGIFWGGAWSSEGETYSISNSVFPNNPLAPDDDGGPKKHTSISTKATSVPSNSPTTSKSTINSSYESSKSTPHGNPTTSKSTLVSSRSPASGSSSASSKFSMPSTQSASNRAPKSSKSPISSNPTSTKSTLGGPPLSKSAPPPSRSPPTPTKPTGTGPITSAAQTSSVKEGQYSSTTQSISGLTANSATTTSREGHPTVLPIWYVGPGVGIIVLPNAGVPVGAPVPPPAGYPPLTIGEDGKPSTRQKEDPQSKITSQSKSSDKFQSTQGQDKETKITSKPGFSSTPSTMEGSKTSSSSRSSTCSSCTSCALETASIDVDEDQLGEIDGIIPIIIPGGKTPSGSPASHTQQPTAPVQLPSSPLPTVSSRPIGAPVCVFADIDRKNVIPETLGGTNTNLRDLFYRMRQEACGGTCSTAGQGVPGDSASVLNDNGQCEIRVAITEAIEAYLYRATPATGDQQQQCWDSLEAILAKCVDSKTPRKGWWNGNHQYQFYEAGVRPLNDGSAKNNAKLTKWLGASTAGLSCQKDCHGFIPDPQWCNKNCVQHVKTPGLFGSLFGQPITTTHFLSRRNVPSSLQAREVKKAKCGTLEILMDFPDYPSTAKEGNAAQGEPARTAGRYQEITRNGWWDYTDRPFDSGMCYRYLRRTADRSPGKDYATEHIYEKHIVKMYLNWLSFEYTEQNGGFHAGRVADCNTMNRVFNTKSQSPNSIFRDVTPAQALANTMSCYGGRCPTKDRIGEFFILEESINKLKENVLGEMRKDADFKALNCKSRNWRENRAKLTTLSAVFQYISHPEVAAVFVKVNNRMRDVLKALDADPFYSQYRPAPLKVPGDLSISHLGWLGAYDYFMGMFLDAAQERTRQYAYTCVNVVVDQINADRSLDRDEKARQVAMLMSNRKSGMWRNEVLAFGDGYSGLMTREWS